LQRAFCCRHRAAASSSAQELGSKSKKQGTNRLDRGDDGDDTTAAILDTTVLWRFRRAEADVKQHERVKRYHRVRLMAALALACGAAAIAAAAQPDPMTDLASRSSIVVLGTVVRVGASEEPLLPATNATAVIKIEKMLAGADLVGDQSGGTATVILKAPQTIKVGARAYFFGNPRLAGKTLTFADEGEIPAGQQLAAAVPPALAAGLQRRSDQPLRERLAIAALVFRGTVQSVRALESEVPGAPRELRSEHDPEWRAAIVRVDSALRGTQNGATVTVIFPNSRDIMWFNVPKPKEGEQWVFLGHRPQEDETRLLRNEGVLRFAQDQSAVVVSHPFDVLPSADEGRVGRVIKEGQ